MISVGIHIHSNGFSVVELSLEGDSLKIKNDYSQMFHSDSKEEHRSIIILEYLKTLEEKYKDQLVRFCYGLPQSQVSSFKMSFPFKEKFKILKTLPFQIEEKSPFRADKIFYDGRITQIKNKSSDVTCFVTPESNIHDFLKLANSLKIKPYLLSVEGAALANVISDWNYDSSIKISGIENSLYIYLGFHGSIVSVFTKGYLDNIYNVEWKASSIIEQMSKKYKLSFEEAVQQFFEKSFILTSRKNFTKEQIFFSELIEKEIVSLIHQIKLLKLSFETKNRIKYENNVILGPGSVIKNLSAYLSTEVSSRFSRLKNLRALKTIDLSEAKNHNLIVPLGLAMEGLKRPPYEGINFLHNLNKKKLQFFSEKWKSLAVGFVMILFLFSFYIFIRTQESQKLADKIHSVFLSYGKNIASIKESKVNVEEVKNYLKNKEFLLEVESLIKEKVSQDSSIDKLKVLTEAIDPKPPWELRVTYLKIENLNVSIRGQISGEFINAFKKRLEKISKRKIKEGKVKERSRVDLKSKQEKKREEQLNKIKNSDVAQKKEGDTKKSAENILEKTSKNRSGQDLEKGSLEEENATLNLTDFSYEFIIKEGV